MLQNCPACQNPVSLNAQTCPKCGNDFTVPAKRHSANTLRWILAAFLIVPAITVAAFVSMSNFQYGTQEGIQTFKTAMYGFCAAASLFGLLILISRRN